VDYYQNNGVSRNDLYSQSPSNSILTPLAYAGGYHLVLEAS